MMVDDAHDDDRVVIVGAGLCGLVAALELHERGIRCVVLEAADRAGGRVQTIRFPDGAVAEGGMEEFWESSPAYELLRRFDIPLLEEAALSSVILDGRLYTYSTERGPEPYFDDLFPGPDAAHFVRWNELAWNLLDEFASGGSCEHRPEKATVGAPDFASFVGELRLPDRLRSWIQVLVETESAVEWSRISVLDGLHEMIPFLVPRAPSAAPRSVRVRGGNFGLVEALLARLPPGTVHLGARVESVSADSAHHGVEVGYTTSDGRAAVARGHHVFLTVPVWALRSLDIGAHLRHGARAALASARCGSYVKVIVRLRPDRLRSWEQDGEYPFTLLTDGPTGCMYLTDGRPEGRVHVLTLLVHGRSARKLNGQSHDGIARCAISELERLDVVDGCRRHGGPRTALLQGLRESITSVVVVDHPQAVAYWPHELGRSRFDALADDLRAPHGRILIGGDTTESSHSDGAVRSGQRMARLVAERIHSYGWVPA